MGPQPLPWLRSGGPVLRGGGDHAPVVAQQLGERERVLGLVAAVVPDDDVAVHGHQAGGHEAAATGSITRSASSTSLVE